LEQNGRAAGFDRIANRILGWEAAYGGTWDVRHRGLARRESIAITPRRRGQVLAVVEFGECRRTEGNALAAWHRGVIDEVDVRRKRITTPRRHHWIAIGATKEITALTSRATRSRRARARTRARAVLRNGAKALVTVAACRASA